MSRRALLLLAAAAALAGLAVLTLLVLGARRRATLLEGLEYLEALAYREPGGRPLLLDVCRPEGVEAGAGLPGVLYLHGGGWRSGSRSRSLPEVTALARRGFVVFNADYRLSGEAPFPAAIQDVRCALAWARRHAAAYGADPARLGLFGTSAGGHLALLAALAPAGAPFDAAGGACGPFEPPAAVVSWYGPTDFLDEAYEDAGRRDGPVAAWLGATRSEDPELYRLASPVAHVDAEDPPVLLIHGEADALVPLGQARVLAEVLERTGVPVELLRVANAGHGFQPADPSRPIEPGWEAILERTASWLREPPARR